MHILNALEELKRPLVLVEIEEKQVCLGHHEFASEHKTREKAKEAGFKWVAEKVEDTTVYNCSFDVDEKAKKRHLLFYKFKHRDDIKKCMNYKVVIVRKASKLVFKEYVEMIPTDLL